jgi:hypothetical protein
MAHTQTSHVRLSFRQTSSTQAEEDERIGEAREHIGPVTFVMCGLFAAGSILFLNYGLCPQARTPEDRGDCDNVANIGGAAFTILCAFPF